MPEFTMTKEEFLRTEIDNDLKKWIGEGPRTKAAFLYSVEEWACQRQGELRRQEMASDA